MQEVSHLDAVFPELASPPCLSFDRVMNGMPIVSQSRLLGLPVEIIGCISQYISSDDLAALALVNSDCRQLARSLQFKDLILNYREANSQILNKLCSDVIGRGIGPRTKDTVLEESFAPENPFPKGKFIGPCIRRLIVGDSNHWWYKRHYLSASELEQLDLDEQAIQDWNKHIWDVREEYQLSINMALIVRSMPHLETLHLEDGDTNLSKEFITAIAMANVKNLSIHGGRIEEEFTLSLPSGYGWPLGNLDISLDWAGPCYEGGVVSPLILSILCCCSRTLETLKWRADWHYPFSLTSKMENSAFPSLRRLTLYGVSFSDSSLLNSLIGPNTRVRELEVIIEKSDEASKAFFMKRGNIQSLEIFICQNSNLMDFDRDNHFQNSHAIDFVMANPQLLKISIAVALPQSLIEDNILPTLKQSFHSLSSLSLVWKDTTISDRAFELISNIHGLRQLQLRAACGNLVGQAPHGLWLVDHDAVRLHLSKLAHLSKLSFNCDTYPIFNDYLRELPSSARLYYIRTIIPQTEEEEGISESARFDPDSEGNGFNRRFAPRWNDADRKIHRMRMLTIADQYAHTLPRLSWIHVGRIAFDIRRESKDIEVVATSIERDINRSLLDRVFGLPTSGDVGGYNYFG